MEGGAAMIAEFKAGVRRSESVTNREKNTQLECELFDTLLLKQEHMEHCLSLRHHYAMEEISGRYVVVFPIRLHKLRRRGYVVSKFRG